MTRVEFSYVNFPHGGRTDANYTGDGGPFDMSGLVRLMSTGTWPAFLGVGEADRWDDNGYEGAYMACAALRAAGGPPYVPHVGSLPRDWGPFAPAILYDPNQVQVWRWYDHKRQHFSSRVRNMLLASLPNRGIEDAFRVIVWHGDIHDGDTRLADAKNFDRFAGPETPAVLMGDWNSTLSGPMWEIGEFNNPAFHRPHRMAHKILFQHGKQQTGPYVADTRALDYLCGYWIPGPRDPRRLWLRRHPGYRAGGIGWHDIAELEGDFTPTQLPHPSGRPPRTIDRALVNKPFADAYISGRYHVHPSLDPKRPDSDHRRISFTLDI
jgi:endonuclease/exonuclease/phosphatase family metal-dependent hydrolase